MKKFRNIYFVIVLNSVSLNSLGQEYGLNFNHNPENIDFKYVKKVNPKWIRTTPRILDYVDGLLNPETDTALQKVVEARKQGYHIVFGFRWDFNKRNLAMPAPGSDREAAYFEVVDKILNRIGPHIAIFSLGNEPNLETIESDLQYDKDHKVPLIVFTERLMLHVIDYYKKHPEWKMPQLYTGSLPALFEKKQQQKPGVYELIKFSHQRPEITGLAVHLHIADTLQIEESLEFVRSIMPHRPIIIPEFSLFRLYNKHFEDKIGSSAEGKAFVEKYKLNPDIKVYEWLNKVNAGEIPYAQFGEMFLSQNWYIPNYLNVYHRYYKKYGIVLATYPLVQQ
ncbi:MAG: hypothetical protein ACO1N7_08905, partial [Sphingobacteriaceae bacterium]